MEDSETKSCTSGSQHCDFTNSSELVSHVHEMLLEHPDYDVGKCSTQNAAEKHNATAIAYASPKQALHWALDLLQGPVLSRDEELRKVAATLKSEKLSRSDYDTSNRKISRHYRRTLQVEALEVIILLNWGLAYYVAHNASSRNLSFEECLEIGFRILHTCAMRYDYELGPFINYAIKAIRKEVERAHNLVEKGTVSLSGGDVPGPTGCGDDLFDTDTRKSLGTYANLFSQGPENGVPWSKMSGIAKAQTAAAELGVPVRDACYFLRAQDLLDHGEIKEIMIHFRLSRSAFDYCSRELQKALAAKQEELVGLNCGYEPNRWWELP